MRPFPMHSVFPAKRQETKKTSQCGPELLSHVMQGGRNRLKLLLIPCSYYEVLLVAAKGNRAINPDNSRDFQSKQKNNPAKGKAHKGLRPRPCKRVKKIWFACRIPVTLFGIINEFSFCIEAIVYAEWRLDSRTANERGPLLHE